MAEDLHDLTLARPYASASSSPEPGLMFLGGATGFAAWLAWIVGSNAADPTSEREIMSALLLAMLGLGAFARRWGVLASISAPASAAICLSIPAWFTCDAPMERHEWFLLGWIATLVGASVVLALIRPTAVRVRSSNVLLELAEKAVVENDGVQWLLLLPRKLQIGMNCAVIELENCHGSERRVELELRQVGTALINGEDRVAPASIDTVVGAGGFVEVCLPIMVAEDGPARVHLWVSVHATPRMAHDRIKTRRAGMAQRYNPMLFSVGLKLDDPATLGFGYTVNPDERAPPRFIKASASRIEEADLRASLAARTSPVTTVTAG